MHLSDCTGRWQGRGGYAGHSRNCRVGSVRLGRLGLARRLVDWQLGVGRVVYRFKVRGEEHIPVQGAAILACNHVSYVDAVLMMAASPRPIRFLMDHRIFATPVLGWLFRLGRATPIAPQRDDPAAYERAFDEARRVLDDGDLLGIFPEGGITRDGSLGEFKGGLMKILQTHPVPVVPLALHNLWARSSRAFKAARP